MKKYKVIFIVLIIGIISVTGFVVYKNCIKPWKDAETYIDKYMVKQDISKDNIKSITKEKAKKANYKDDPRYEYQYFYSDNYYALYVNKVMLQIYDMENNNKLLRSNEELKSVKYPLIYLKYKPDK